MDPKIYIPVLAALAGAFVGALIKELSSFYQMRREDKRVLKKVLFNQLDIWYEVRRLYYAPAVTIALKKMSQSFSRAGMPYETIHLQLEQFRPQLISLLREMKIGEPEKLLQRYQEAVSDLSKVDPVLAFKISGRPEVERSLGKLDAVLDHPVAGDMSPTDRLAAGKLIERLEPAYEEAVVVRTLTLLQEDIWRVSRRIGVITCFKALWEMQKIKQRSASEHDPEGDKFIDTYVTYVMEMFKNEPQTSTGSNVEAEPVDKGIQP